MDDLEDYQSSIDDRLQLFQPHLNVERFMACILMSDSTLSYLMHKLPYLEKLTINSEGFDNHDKNGLQDLNVSADAFFAYISNMREFVVAFTPSSLDLSTTIKRYFTMTRVTPVSLKIVHDDIRATTKKSAIFIYNSKRSVDDERRYRDFGHYRSQKFLQISFSLSHFALHRETISETLHYLNIDKDLGYKLKELHLSSHHTQFGYPPKVYDDITSKTLYQAVVNCPNLKKLILTHANITRNTSYNKTKNPSVTTLILEYCKLKANTLKIASACFPSLKYVAIAPDDEEAIDDIERKGRAVPFVVNLPHSSIDTSTWNDGGNIKYKMDSSDYSRLYLKVKSSVSGVKNYILLSKKLKTQDGSSKVHHSIQCVDKLPISPKYEKYPPYIVIHVICKSIRLFRRDFTREYPSRPYYSAPQKFVLLS